MSHRPAASSPTITSLLASSTPTKVFLPSLSNLVTSAVTSTSTEQLAAANASASGNKRKKINQVISNLDHLKKGCSKFCGTLAGAPTLSMLLELPPSVPGTPLPELPAPVESTEMPVQEVKMESPLMRQPGSAELLQCNYLSARLRYRLNLIIFSATAESSMEFEKQLQNFDKNAVRKLCCVMTFSAMFNY
jgi:hypothetical protein